MAALYTKFINLIDRDITNECESKDLIVLIRIQSIIDILYSIILCVFFFVYFDALSGFVSIAFGLVHLIVLCLTYKRSTRMALLLYCITVALSTVFYCQYISPGLGFRYVIFAIIPLIYFKTDESWGFRISWSLLSAVFSIWLAIVGLFYPTHWDIAIQVKIALIVLSTLSLTIKLMVISHFYYKKFSTDEYKIIKYAQKLEILSNQDALTKLQNRRGIEKYLQSKVESPSENDNFTLAMADVDFFKKVNDTYGHEAGDYVLKEISDVMSAFMADKGRLARWGGEEFLLVFDMNGDRAFVEADNLRHQIEKHDFDYEGTHMNLTMTFGIEEYSPYCPVEDSIEAADKKLYLGKTSGRNKVVY